MRVLVVNAGSSSLKLSVLDPAGTVLAAHTVSRWSGDGAADEVARFVRQTDRIDAVGHRVVHGGADFRGPAVLDPVVRERIAALTDLAPLHQPQALAGIDAVRAALPDAPAVACFDTAFHADLPAAATTYALPARWRQRWPLRRYGFHGLSHAHATRRAAELLGRDLAGLRIVSCHLGAGASLAAVAGGRSVDTTMGFTPLEGLVMATRSGSVDPGLLLWLLQRGGLTVSEVSEALEHESGLTGLAGSGDLRDVRRAAAAGDSGARLAVEVYQHRLRREIAAMAAAMNGLDVLVFTGGVGEHDPWTRAEAAGGLAFLGVRVAPDRNEAVRSGADADISAAGAHAATVVVAAREDLEIAREVRATLTTGTAHGPVDEPGVGVGSAAQKPGQQ
ncbi:MAG: acetate/propionate family kinase [Actinobacteria bacterium]|nr:acetate/propionate family kinase [Actinomycetota bacterium]